MGDYAIDTHYKIRYLLDAYTQGINGEIKPLAARDLFSTKAQADQILQIAQGIDPQAKCSIAENSKQIQGGVQYNYRDDVDSSNLYAFAIIIDRKGSDGKLQHIEQFVGDLILDRIKSHPSSITLIINDVGQLAWN